MHLEVGRRRAEGPTTVEASAPSKVLRAAASPKASASVLATATARLSAATAISAATCSVARAIGAEYSGIGCPSL